MNKFSKIVLGYILAIVLVTVLILSVNIQLRKTNDFTQQPSQTGVNKNDNI